MTAALVFHLRAATEIWTGGADQKNDKLQPTGLLGSLRWWVEAVARGLGDKACDPTCESMRCKGYTEACYTCRLFGLAGGAGGNPHAAQFAFRISDRNPRSEARWMPRTEKITAGTEFYMSFFAPCRREPGLDNGQRWLLAKTMEIICKYGAMGGRTTKKPANYDGHRRQHVDYGILNLLGMEPADSLDEGYKPTIPRIADAAPNLNNFFFVEHAFEILRAHDNTKPTFNALVGLSNSRRPVSKLFRDGADALREHLRGEFNVKSKKIFSFRVPARTWGYVLDGALLEQLPALLRSAGCTASPVYGSELLKGSRASF